MHLELSICSSIGLLHHGAHAPKQEGMGGWKRGIDFFKAAAFLHILSSIPYHDYNNK